MRPKKYVVEDYHEFEEIQERIRRNHPGVTYDECGLYNSDPDGYGLYVGVFFVRGKFKDEYKAMVRRWRDKCRIWEQSKVPVGFDCL